MRILAIETSCDETAAAVYTSQAGVLSNVLYSQIELHQKFGGVVPEIASRSHLEKIEPIVQQALDQAEHTLDDIDAIAVTNKPGLPGSLLVGVSFAKAVAWANDKPLIGVNHLEGHAFSACIEHSVQFPSICLTVSGGHSALYLLHDFGKYSLIGHTRDDAAGEAFDKIAKLIGLSYPGGPVIERLAREVDFQDFFHYPRAAHKGLDMSFSGLKTAVLYDLVKRGAYDMATKKFLKPDDHALQQQVASSLLVCIGDIFEEKILNTYAQYPEAQSVCFVGGVACNKYLKQRLALVCHKQNINFHTPSPQYCTDNGAMIAFVGHYKAQRGEFSSLDLDILK